MALGSIDDEASGPSDPAPSSLLEAQTCAELQARMEQLRETAGALVAAHAARDAAEARADDLAHRVDVLEGQVRRWECMRGRG